MGTLYTSIPAYCPTCKNLFHNSAIALGPGGGIVMEAASTIGCPKGHKAHFLKGSYSFQDGVLQLASTSPETLNLLKSLSEGVIRGEVDREHAAAKIIELAPALAPAFTGKPSDWLPWFALLAYLVVELTKVGLANNEAKISPPVIINQIYNQCGNIQACPGPKTIEAPAHNRTRSKRQKRRDRGRGYF